MAGTEDQALVRELMAKDSRATPADALSHAIAAADLYMTAYKETGPGQQGRKAGLRRKFEELVLLAEQLKKQSSSQQSLDRQNVTADEDSILSHSSDLHGNRFHQWRSNPTDVQFSVSRDGRPFTDSTEYAMSQLQLSILDEWKRPAALLTTPERSKESWEAALMEPVGTCDLVQDITTDCSVVASLCAAMKILLPGSAGVPLLSTLMFPFDHENNRPRVSPNGKYIFRMHFNGCFREVVVDDRLPVSRVDIGRNLFVVDRRNPNLLWPALMEKAYLKVRGGYDFPGSNSGTDLWVLTGWIPEQLFLQSEDVDLERAWDRMARGYERDNVIITLGTGRLSPTEEETLGLVGEHDYAVLDMDSTNGARRLLVKNPWCDGLVWKGEDASSRRAAEPTQPDQSWPATGAHLEMVHPSTSSGTFWITLEEVAQNFESMYLNWNPACFAHRQDRHFKWNMPKRNMAGTFAYNPQYTIRASARSSVWVLLSRHFADEELEIARNRRPGSLASVAKQLGYTSISVFENGGCRVEAPDGALYRGPYVDSLQTLAKLDLEADKPYTVVMAQEDLPLDEYACTFSFFSTVNLQIAAAKDEMGHYQEISGSWTRRTAGGNAASPLYSQNPQFGVYIPQATPLSVLLATGSQGVAIHIDLVWSTGKRVTSITRKDVVASSGDYRGGNAYIQTPTVQAGSYIIVCSTFESGQLADFTMRVGAMVPLTIRPMPAEGAGLLRSPAPPVDFPTGVGERRIRISAPRLTRAHAVASCPLYTDQDGQHAPRASLRMSILYGRGSQASLVAVSAHGAFREPITSLRTSEFDIEPERLQREELWLVVELLGSPAAQGGVQIEFLGDNQVYADHWEAIYP
ncbi:calpain-7 [Plectosphaerella plurivora]|uniref:Calpain-7 n=1 Tax=Plectosphaerella plurivora TaxID=936078 RepID=A0A9P8V0E3_9PEZI|nr:calpain-7 [Plectosphaerella plurivora]